MFTWYLECISPLGMEDNRIKNLQITTSSVIKGGEQGGSPYGWLARLNRNIPGWGAWCPDVSGGSKTGMKFDQYIQIDLLKLTKITGIATQGREYKGAGYTKNYKISFRRDGGVWHFYQEKDETLKVNLTDILNLIWCVRILKTSLYNNVNIKNEVPNCKHFVEVFCFLCIKTCPDYIQDG